MRANLNLIIKSIQNKRGHNYKKTKMTKKVQSGEKSIEMFEKELRMIMICTKKKERKISLEGYSTEGGKNFEL